MQTLKHLKKHGWKPVQFSKEQLHNLQPLPAKSNGIRLPSWNVTIERKLREW